MHTDMHIGNGKDLEREWLRSEKYGGVETTGFFEDLARLQAGEPLAYLIGHVPFLDATIYLDSRPLIPRAETEYWVEKAIAEIKEASARNGNRQLSILDLCAGSGCVGVAVVKAVPMASVDFAEIDAGHHPTIAKNLKENGIDPKRARIFGGDLFSDLPKETRYDFILSNPPYIDPQKTGRIQKSVTEYEPSHALFGGESGMEYIARILKEAPRYLASPSVLYIEHEPEQTAWIRTLVASLSYTSCDTHSDQWQRDRYTRLVQANST